MSLHDRDNIWGLNGLSARLGALRRDNMIGALSATTGWEAEAIRKMAHESHCAFAAVSSIAQRLLSPCMSIVRVVDPLRQRTNPSSNPIRKTCTKPNQSY